MHISFCLLLEILAFTSNDFLSSPCFKNDIRVSALKKIFSQKGKIIDSLMVNVNLPNIAMSKDFFIKVISLNVIQTKDDPSVFYSTLNF